MTTNSLFFVPESSIEQTVNISFEGETITVPSGISVAAALLASGIREFRLSIVGQTTRAPYCMMGLCFECLLEIDGVPARQSCLIPVRDGMQIKRQLGAPKLNDTTVGVEHD